MIIETFTSLSINHRCSIGYYPHNNASKFSVKLSDPIIMDENSDWIVGVTSFSHGTVDKMNSNYICLHIDFISNQIMGDKSQKVIFIGALNKCDDIIFNHSITNIQMCRVEKTNIEEIHCFLTNEFGDPIKFMNDEIITNIVLKIKKSI
jgi:hypothetical protein